MTSRIDVIGQNGMHVDELTDQCNHKWQKLGFDSRKCCEYCGAITKLEPKEPPHGERRTAGR